MRIPTALRRPGGRRLIVLLSAIAALVLVIRLSQRLDDRGPGPAVEGSSPAATVLASDAAVREAFETQRSGLVVSAVGVVDRTLPDDQEGDRHQRFILRLTSGHTLLMSHNIDLAPRVPIAIGDTVEFRGQYEWNERGGVIHWTHHDPDGRRPGGWLRHRSRVYR